MVRVAIEVTATTSMDEEVTSPVKELTTTNEEEAPIKVDLSGIAEEEDCREPIEECTAAVVSDDRVADVEEKRAQEEQESDELVTPPASEEREKVPVDEPEAPEVFEKDPDNATMLQPTPDPSTAASEVREEVQAADEPETPEAIEEVQEHPQVDLQQPKPTITIARRSRTMPTYNTNSIANITYVDAPKNTDTIAPDSIKPKESLESPTPSQLSKEQTLDDSSKIVETEQASVVNSVGSKKTIASAIGSKIAKVRSKSRGRGKKSKTEKALTHVAPVVEEKEEEVKSEDTPKEEENTEQKSEESTPEVVENTVEGAKSSETVEQKSVESTPPLEPIAADSKSVATVDDKSLVSVKSEDVKADLADPVGNAAEELAEASEAPAPVVAVNTDVPVDVDLVSPTSIATTSDADIQDSIKPIASASSNSVNEKVEVTKAPSKADDLVVEEEKAVTRRSRIGRSASRIRSSSTRGAKQLKSVASSSSKKISETSKSLATSSKAMASTSSRRISETSKSLAMSSKSAFANVRARSRSRVRGSKRQEDSKPVIEAQGDSIECISFDATAAADDLKGDNTTEVPEEGPKEVSDAVITETKPEEVGVTDQVPTEEINDTDIKDDMPTDSVTNATIEPEEPESVDNVVPEVDTTAPVQPAAPTSPAVKSPPSGFMGRFFSGLFCKTDYLGDFTTLCGGGEAAVTSPIAAQTGVALGVIQRAMESPRSPSTTNAVEVSPIFDEPSLVEPQEASPSPEESGSPKPNVGDITPPLEPTPSIDLQSSSLRSTKSNKSLTLITEVTPQPTESFKDVPVPSPADAPELSGVSGSTKSTRKKMDLRINTSFFKKSDQIPSSEDTGDNAENKESESSSFNLTRSLKASLKTLSPRGSDVFKSFKRSVKGNKEAPVDCLSPVNTRQGALKPDPDLDGIRIYGGGVTVPVDDKTQYPKFSLDYKRTRGGFAGFKKHMNRHVSHFKETAMTYNKVLQHQMVKASQPKVRAIMTNHVHQKEQATNKLYN